MSREANPPIDDGMRIDDRISDRISEVQERAAGVASKIKDKASHFGSSLSQTADRQRENAAKGLHRAALTLHDGIGSAAKAGHGFADGMTSTASYIRSHSFGEMGTDAMDVCRRHPVEAMISAAVLGFIVGRAIRR
jgi:hypothetical protein